MTVVPFVVVFAFLLFRQLMHVSHIETHRRAGASAPEPPSTRAAAFYLAGDGARRHAALPAPAARPQPDRARASRLADERQHRPLRHDRLQQAAQISADYDRRQPRLDGRRRHPVLHAAAPARRGVRPLPRQRVAAGAARVPRAQISATASAHRAADRAVPARHRAAALRRRHAALSPHRHVPVEGVPQIFEGPTRDVYTIWQPRGDIVDVRRPPGAGDRAAEGRPVPRRQLPGHAAGGRAGPADRRQRRRSDGAGGDDRALPLVEVHATSPTRRRSAGR